MDSYILSPDGSSVIRLTPQSSISSSTLNASILPAGFKETSGNIGSLSVTNYTAGFVRGTGGANFEALENYGSALPAGDKLEWVQIINTNDPLGGNTSPYLDNASNTSVPFYSFTAANRNPGLPANELNFYDYSRRAPADLASHNPIAWDAKLYPVLWDGNKALTVGNGVEWGWTMNKAMVGSDTATFLNPSPSGSTTSGVGTSSFSWGIGSDQSKISFVGAHFDATPNTPFKLGTLTYHNGTTYGNEADSVQFNLSFNFDNIPEKNFSLPTTFNITTTPNTDDPQASADYLTIGNYNYTFHSLEGQTASVDIYGTLGTDLSGSPSTSLPSSDSSILSDPFDPSANFVLKNLTLRDPSSGGFIEGVQPPASLADAAVINGHVSAANDTATQALTGTADANSTVTVYDNGTALAHPVTADASGHWSYTLGQLSVGAHSLTATATDAAGNTSAASAALAFTVDTAGGGSGGGSTNEALFGTVTTDPHSAGGEVYALYEGLLGRAPDTAGLEYWADQFSHGASPATLTSGFLGTAEGQARLGAADDTGFVQQLYQNTLHRAPDSAGLSYWTNQLAHGESRVDVADSFVFSPEFTSNTVQPAISSGLFVPDANASEVARIYYTMLDRAPDASGLQYWTSLLDHGTAPYSVALAFLAQPENQAKYGGLSNSAYVDALYVNALGRHADSGGLSYWTSQLDHGGSRADLAVQLSQSPEAQNVHLAQIEQGYHLA